MAQRKKQFLSLCPVFKALVPPAGGPEGEQTLSRVCGIGNDCPRSPETWHAGDAFYRW